LRLNLFKDFNVKPFQKGCLGIYLFQDETIYSVFPHFHISWSTDLLIYRSTEIRSWKLEAGSLKIDDGKWKMEAGSTR